MKPAPCLILAALSAASPSFAAPVADARARPSSRPAETPHLAFVREYVREVEENEAILERTRRELAASAGDNDRLTTTILAAERTILALQNDQDQLKLMRLRGDFQALPALIIHAYDRKIALAQRVLVMAAAAVADPKSAIRRPSVAADVETIDKALFEATGLVVSTIIERGEDKPGRLRRLTITSAERRALIDDLTRHLGDAINHPGGGYVLASASLIKGLLLDRKCADEP